MDKQYHATDVDRNDFVAERCVECGRLYSTFICDHDTPVSVVISKAISAALAPSKTLQDIPENVLAEAEEIVTAYGKDLHSEHVRRDLCHPEF